MHSATKEQIARKLGPAKIRLYGRQGPLGMKQKEAYHRGKNLGIQSLCSVLPADDGHPGSWHQVVDHQPGEVLYGEAIVLDRVGQGVIFTSRDCPITIIADERSGKVGVAHTGRRSLLKTGSDCQSCDSGVLENLFAAMGIPYGENLLVFVTGGISASNFPHRKEEVLPFVEKFGHSVVPDPSRNTLDLFRVIRKICMKHGVAGRNIFSDNICTFETPWTGSRRAGRDGSNWTYVIKTR